MTVKECYNIAGMTTTWGMPPHRNYVPAEDAVQVSGGSAAALASGFGALSIGSDIAGSLRTPAHFCGVYAHKPTLGLAALIGPMFEDRTPLRLAELLEQKIGGFHAPK